MKANLVCRMAFPFQLFWSCSSSQLWDKRVLTPKNTIFQWSVTMFLYLLQNYNLKGNNLWFLLIEIICINQHNGLFPYTGIWKDSILSAAYKSLHAFNYIHCISPVKNTPKTLWTYNMQCCYKNQFEYFKARFYLLLAIYLHPALFLQDHPKQQWDLKFHNLELSS